MGNRQCVWLTLLVLACTMLLRPTSLWADTTAPTTPVVTDDGAYTRSTTKLHASWSSADPESGIRQYQYQVRMDSPSGVVLVDWTSTGTATSVTRARLRLQQGRSYFFGVKAKNGAGRSSAVGFSDGIRVDTTAPSPVSVTDDGATTSSLTSLHATWSASSDPESGIMQYEYLIRQDSPSGTIIVNWTEVGLATEVTRAGLSLLNGTIYFIGVRARNGALLYASPRYSDGLLVQTDTTPPTGSVSIDGDAAYATTTAVTLTLSATDDSGTVSQMQCSNDGTTYSTPEAYATTKSWTLASGDGLKRVSVKFSDPSGNWSSPVSDAITLDTRAPLVAIVEPKEGDLIGGG